MASICQRETLCMQIIHNGTGRTRYSLRTRSRQSGLTDTHLPAGLITSFNMSISASFFSSPASVGPNMLPGSPRHPIVTGGLGGQPLARRDDGSGDSSVALADEYERPIVEGLSFTARTQVRDLEGAMSKVRQASRVSAFRPIFRGLSRETAFKQIWGHVRLPWECSDADADSRTTM